MNSDHVNPFIEAAVSTFETMCNITPRRNGKPFLRVSATSEHELIGVLPLRGSVSGMVVMGMPQRLAESVVSAFLGEDCVGNHEDLLDGFGEILNIIAGSAAAKLDQLNVLLGLPSVLLRQQLSEATDQRRWVVIPMHFPELQSFAIEVSMEEVS